MWQRFPRSTLWRYSICLVATAVALLLRKLLNPLLGDYAPYITLYPTIVFLSIYAGVGPSVVALFLGLLGVTYWFMDFRGSFRVNDIPAHVVLSLMFVAVGACIIAAGQSVRRAQRALTASSKQLRRFLEAAPTGLTRCSRDLRYVAANSAYAETAGLPADAIVGRPIVDVMGVAGWERIRPYVERVLRGERVEYETVLPFASGGPRELHVVYTPEKEGQEVVGWVASVTDITEFKRLQNRLQEMEKRAAAGQLAASLAHEINNPLSTVINALFLLGNSDLDPASAGLISTANDEIARVARIVKQSLSYYRAEVTAEEIDLATLIQESLQVFSDKFQRNGIVISRKIGAGASISGVAHEIRQVVDNLLINAADAMPRGGHLTLCLRQSRTWRKPSELGVRFTIADNGCGIPKPCLARVFEPFFTTKAEKGTGLGLWVVKGIIEKYGGNIRIRSTNKAPRSGTVVSIFWPKNTVTKRLVRPEYAA